jgi:hypothetical protein
MKSERITQAGSDRRFIFDNENGLPHRGPREARIASFASGLHPRASTNRVNARPHPFTFVLQTFPFTPRL